MYFIHEIWPGNTNSVLLGELPIYSLELSARSSHTGLSLNLLYNRLWYLANIIDTLLFFSIGTIWMNPKNAQVNVITCLFLSAKDKLIGHGQ